VKRILAPGGASGRSRATMRSVKRIVMAMAMFAIASVANAVELLLLTHNQTSGTGTVSTLITDGSHMQGQPASNVVWDWDGTTLTSTGLYSAVGSLGSSTLSPTILNDQVTNLSIDTGTSTATATAYLCNEGTFLAGVGANGCGGYSFGSNFLDESTTVWGPGLGVSQTIGGDDVSTDGPRTIANFDFGLDSVTGTGLATGDEVRIGNGIPVGTPDGELMTFEVVSTAVAVDDAASGRANETIDIDVLANDTLVDNVSALTTTAPTNGTAVVVGAIPGPQAGLSIDYKSAIGFSGNATFDYTVTDTDGKPRTATVTVTVSNQVPVAVNDVTSTAVGTPIVVNVLANDTLGDGPSRSVDVTVAPTDGAINTAVPVTCTTPANCALTYTPSAMGSGNDVFTYSLTDANGDVDTATVTVNRSTELGANDDMAATEIGMPVNIDVLANDVNLLNPDYTVDVTSAPTKGVVTTTLPITCLQAADCALSYTPNAGQVGNDTFTYQVTDNLMVSSTANVTIFINDVPVAVDDPAMTATTAIPASLDVQANDTGLNDTPVAVSVVAPPANGTAMPDGGNPELVTYTSNPGFVGQDMFTYSLQDDNGDTSNTATVTVTVGDQPMANDDGTMGAPAFVVPPGTSLSLDVLANDTGLSDTPLTVTLVNPSATLGAPTVIGSPGNASAVRIDYAAGPTLGTDSFGYQITDASGDVSSATAYVAVASTNVPIAVDDTDAIFGDETSIVNVLANDTGLADTPLTVTIISDPANGFVQGVSGCTGPGQLCEVWYIPDAGFGGTDSYTYMITDSTAESSNVATVTVTVTQVPIAADDAASTSNKGPITINVLANDQGLVNPPFTVAAIPNAAFLGTAVVQSDNTILFTPSGGQEREDVLDYSVTDANGRSSIARVRVAITPVQGNLPGEGSSALGPVGLFLLALVTWLRRRV